MASRMDVVDFLENCLVILVIIDQVEFNGFMEAIFGIWFSEKFPDRELQKALLGKF